MATLVTSSYLIGGALVSPKPYQSWKLGSLFDCKGMRNQLTFLVALILERWLRQRTFPLPPEAIGHSGEVDSCGAGNIFFVLQMHES
mmetsp:Transcript_27773/g.57820  ORF Transcript_27773/g.57820 Transcript_27773/m.57820 type:complete len:87 (-) Transcript_27773:40-300(-)